MNSVEKRSLQLAVAFVTLAAFEPPPALSHHSQAPFFDQSRDVEIEGVVQRFDYRNPHAVLYVEVSNGEGGIDVWSLQFASLAILMRAGITPDLVAAGDRIKAIGHPSWNPGSFGMAGVAITTSDGREFVDPLRNGNFTPAAERQE
jgi:hypothetical protein